LINGLIHASTFAIADLWPCEKTEGGRCGRELRCRLRFYDQPPHTALNQTCQKEFLKDVIGKRGEDIVELFLTEYS
jgi:hypothetical protein